MKRRQFVQSLGAGSAIAGLGLMSGCATTGSSAKVVVVGGGYGGATAAKYVRMFSDQSIEVTLLDHLIVSDQEVWSFQQHGLC